MTDNIVIWVLLLLSLVVSAACTIMIKNLLKAAIALAVTSAVLTVVMFLMGATLAAVLELSVCAGLITAVFVSTISMTKNVSAQAHAEASKKRLKKIIFLPFLLLAAGVAVYLLFPNPNVQLALGNAADMANNAVRTTLWDSRQLDILGQIIIVLAGVFGVVVLFKGKVVKK